MQCHCHQHPLWIFPPRVTKRRKAEKTLNRIQAPSYDQLYLLLRSYRGKNLPFLKRARLNIFCREKKRVRFRIVTVDSGIKLFTPDDPAAMTAQLGTAASGWGYQQLTYLNAFFDYNHEYSFGPLIRLPVVAGIDNSNFPTVVLSHHQKSLLQ